MSDETEVQAVSDPAPIAPVVVEAPSPVANPTAVHGVLENIEAEWAKFEDFFRGKIADIRSHL
jgi:hypothetical protein